jgi:type I restriction enzyme S subunit
MPRGDKQAIMRYKVPKFSVDKQIKIVKILGIIDDKIKLNEMINRNLEEQATIYFDNWFHSIVGEEVELSSVINITDGTHDSPKAQKTGYPLVTSKHLLPFDIDLATPNKISLSDYEKINERSKVEQFDILMSMIGTVGNISYIYQNDINFAIKNIALFKTSQKIEYSLFILMYLKSQKVMQQIDKCLAGSTQKYISLMELRRLPIVIPSNNSISLLNSTLQPIIYLICNNISENRRLSTLRDTLLPKLMSGELDVSNIDI